MSLLRNGLVEITMPDEFVRLANEWHSGQACILYAAGSSGGLYLGSIRPWEDDRPLTDQEWHHSL